MSYCQHDVYCPGYGPLHDEAVTGVPSPRLPASYYGQALSNTKRKRLERARRSADEKARR